ncbi:oligosaccharide flippase family protein [Flavobacterium terrisoli]|uniref:oligosaccharide flippase family protein n=1 Tax=Flavobacterium terrisoli TaxID=3242195 RepID=UPI002542C349|nr:oligosaccharide flippase family protein [Flavobacterium buctense]
MLREKIAGKLKSQQFKNFIIYGFGQAVNLISPLLVIPYIVFVCGEEGLGKAGVGFSFALIAIVLVDYGSYINGTKEVAISHSDKSILEEKFTTIYLSKLILLVCVLLCCSLIIFTIPFFQKDKYQLLLSLLIVVGQFINPTWFFQGIQNFKWISIINVLSKVIYVASVFLLIKKPEDYIYINSFLGIGSIIASSLGFLWIYNHYSFSLKNCSFPKALALIKSEFSLTVSQLFFSFYQYAPIMVISYVGGNFMAGQYRIIDQIVMIFRTYFQMFFNFIYADVCRQIYDNVRIGISQWKLKNGLNYLMILLILIVFYCSTQFILLFFKVNPQDIEELGSYFKIGLLIPVFMGISFALKQLMFSFNKNREYIRITIFSTVLSLLMLFFLLSGIGLKGAFISTIIAEFFIIVSYILVLKSSFAKETIKT